MLILHILPDLTVGGAEMMMKRLISSHLTDPRFEHRVISLRGLGTIGPALQAQGVQVDALGLHSARHAPRALWRLVRAIRSVRPDIVQTWMYHSDLLGGIAAKVAGSNRIIWGVRIADINVGVAPMTAKVRRLCALLSSRIPTRILYVAESARRIHESIGYARSKAVVIPNGFEILDPLPLKNHLRAELGLNSGVLLIGSAGRFNPQKDYRTFIQACGMMAEEHSTCHFVLAGRGVDRSNQELLGWINETGVGDRFHLLGERNDLSRCLAALDLFCMHSLQEGFPNVVGEAMAVGVPCVVTEVGDAALLVGNTGIVVPPAQPSALASAMCSLIGLPSEERKALGHRARERILEHFSMDAIRAKFETLYDGLMNRPASAR